jgi:hypothetical protein
MKAQIRDAAQSSPKRLVIWIIGSLLIHVVCLAFFSAGICGCHFHLIALLFGAPPLIWAAYVTKLAKTKGERFLAVLNLLCAAGWVYIEWEGNVRFVFSH